MKKEYDIFQAAEILNLSAAYVRLQTRLGVIPSRKVPVAEGSAVMKTVITEKDLNEFARRDFARAPRRDDGRAKCCFYATPEEVDHIKELLYTSNDPGLMAVAQTISTSKDKGERYVPPSKLKLKS